MGTVEIEAFKNELKNLWFYQKKAREFDSKIELLIYEMENVKGVDYTKTHGTGNPEAIEQNRLKMIELKESLEQKKAFWEAKENYLCGILKNMSSFDRRLVIEVIADKRKYSAVCKELNIGKSSLAYRVDRAILQALKKGG